jgi:hypothetical protein
MQKVKVLNLALVLTSLLGYLEWGNDNSSFLFQAEADVLSKMFTSPGSVVHPFTMLPLIGQLLLLITLFQKSPGKYLSFIGMACVGLLIGFMLVAGLLTLNFKIVLSTAPFFVAAAMLVQHFRRTV